MKTILKSKTASWLNKSRNLIDLEPFFQRGAVWSKKKQQHFLDSILKNWGTPKIFLWKTGNDNFACVDGKQRLISLFNFMDNQLPLNSEYSDVYGNKICSNLPPDMQIKIENYKFAVEILTDGDDEEIFDFFKRLQRGTSLNSGENLYGVSGKINDFIKNKLINYNFFKEKSQIFDKCYNK